MCEKDCAIVNAKKTQDTFDQQRQEFLNNLDNLFDIAHIDALQIIKISEDKVFLQRQREPGRTGCLAGVDKNLADKEERVRLRTIEEEKRQRNPFIEPLPSTCSFNEVQNYLSSDSDETIDSLPILTTEIQHATCKTHKKKDFVTPKLVAALDRCQLSMRDSMFILEATIEALGHSSEDFSISKSSIQRIRTTKRKDRAEAIKRNFQNQMPDVVTIHWDRKLIPALDSRKSKEERLPIVISYGSQEQLLAVPCLESSTRSEQA